MGPVVAQANLDAGLWGPNNWRRNMAIEFVALEKAREEQFQQLHAAKRQERAIKAAEDANAIAKGVAGDVAEATRLAGDANRIARRSAAGTIGAFLLAALAFAKSMGWF